MLRPDGAGTAACAEAGRVTTQQFTGDSGRGTGIRRAPRGGLIGLAAALACAPEAGAQLIPQLSPKATVIENARVHTMIGPPIDNAKVVIRGGKIAEVGAGIETPRNSTVIDAAGRTVTPGLIDADSLLGLNPGGPGGSVLSRAFDGFDRYARVELRDALRNGVTAAYLRPGRGRGIVGTGAVVRLVPLKEGGMGEVLTPDAALSIDLASNDRPMARLSVYDGVRKRFRAALDYRESLDTYKEELEQYEKKIKERADKEQAEKDKADAPKPAEGQGKPAPGGDAPAPGPSPAPGGRSRPGAEPDALDAPGTADRHDASPGAEDAPADLDADRAAGAESALPQPERRPPGQRGTPPGDAKPGDAPASGEKKEDEIKKPTEPKPDRELDFLLKVLDGEIPVRVEAHRAADIENALALAREFNLRLVIEGASEAHLLTPELAEAEVPVVLGSALVGGVYQDDARQRRAWDAAGVLRRAGVRFAVGSGAEDANAGRFVLQNAQIVAQRAGSAKSGGGGGGGGRGDGLDPLRLVTADAADLLGVGDEIGRIRAGLRADLVIWSGDPLDPGTRVEEVYVEGARAYAAPRRGGGGS